MKDKLNKLKNSGRSKQKLDDERQENDNLNVDASFEENKNSVDTDSKGEYSVNSEADSSQDDESLDAGKLASEVKELEDKVTKLENEKVDLNEQYLRLRAEYDNYVRRSTKEKQDRYNDALFDVCSAWLPVLDNIDRALDASAKVDSSEAKTLAEGVAMVRDQALEVLKSLGVEEIKALGEKFDPELHEAVMHIEDPEYDEATIAEVFQKGYKKGDKVLRYSVVKVAN